MSQKKAWLTAALDAIAQFRATKEPLKVVVKRLSTKRNLGSKERELMRNAVFAWSKMAGENIVEQTRSRLLSNGVSRPTLRQIDEAILSDIEKGDFGAQEQGSFPSWFVRKIKSDYGSESIDLLEALGQRAGLCLAYDARKVEFVQLEEAFKNLHIEVQESDLIKGAIRIRDSNFHLSKLPRSLQSHVWVMDEGSQYAASQVHIDPESCVLDYCAGAGGKSKYLLSKGAKVVAMDISESRLLKAAQRCNTENISYVVGDGCEPPFLEGSFDTILLDAPCSGSGTIRRAPDLLARLEESKIDDYVRLQQTLLQNACRLLKANGQLLYVTCSLFKNENDEQVIYAKRELSLECEAKRQLLPSKDFSDGFFVASFRKTGDFDAAP